MLALLASLFLILMSMSLVFSCQRTVLAFSASSCSINYSLNVFMSISFFLAASCHCLRESSSRLTPDFIFFISCLSLSIAYSCSLKSICWLLVDSSSWDIIPPGVVLDIPALPTLLIYILCWFLSLTCPCFTSFLRWSISLSLSRITASNSSHSMDFNFNFSSRSLRSRAS